MVNFDRDFGVGFLAGLATGVFLYRLWLQYKQWQVDSRRRLARTGRTATPTIDRRYVADLIKFCQSSHLAGHRIALSDILVEPRFMRAPDLVGIPEDEVGRNVFDVVPRIHDFPYLYAPYNIPTLSIEELGRGERAVALIGVPGSGRTTALLSMALWSLGQLEFGQEADSVEEQIELSEAELSPEERAERIRNRLRALQEAQLRVRREEGTIVDEDEEAIIDTVPVLRQLAPLYVHLANVSLRGYGRRVDPAEPLVNALQEQSGVRSVTRKTMPGSIYRLLNNKRGLVLIDGYDDLPERERAEKLAWLKAFLDDYAGNFIVIAMPPDGYYELETMGVAPVFLRPWSDAQIGNHLDQWARHARTIGYNIPAEDVIDELNYNGRALPAVDHTLRTWSTFTGGGGTNRGNWVMDYLRQRLPDVDDLLPVLKQMAALQLDEGYIRRSRVIELEATAPAQQGKPTIQKHGISEEGATAVSDETLLSDDDEETVRVQGARGIRRQVVRIFNRLAKNGILLRYRGGRFQFQHPVVAAYLASLALADVGREMVEEKVDEPSWELAVAYAGARLPLDYAAARRLQTPTDVLYSNVLSLTRWLSYLTEDNAWRGILLRYLGNLFVAPNQYGLVRERIASALISSRDSGALVIFRRALQSNNPDVARLGCLGIGALRDEAAVQTLSQMMQLEHPDIPLAAALALGSIGTENARRVMRQALMNARNDDVKRAIAETFAADPRTGYLTLYEAIQNTATDIPTRRATVFGLGRIPKDWALIEVDDVIHSDDEQYFVQSAAREVLSNLYSEEKQGAHAYPAPTAVPWLLEWAQEQIAAGNIPPDIEGVQLLSYALEQDTDPLVRELAAATAGQLSILETVRPIYNVLRDDDPAARNSAYRSLGDLQMKMGKTLPAPI